MWQNTQKQLKIDPSQAAWRACLADSRGQNVALGSAINQLRSYANMWQITHKSSWKSTLRSKNVAEHGRILIKKLHFYTKMWWNTQINYHAFHTKKWQNTQKHLKIDPSQGPNTMAWRVQPRRFSSMFIADTRCQNVALEYTINQLRFHTNMWRNTEKQLKIDPAQAKCGGTRKNPHQKATFLHENVAKHTNQLRKCGKTHKSTWKLILRSAQTPWPGVFNRGVFWARLADTRCQNVALESTINLLRFHRNMWRNAHKSSWKSTLRRRNVAEHGRILIKKLHFYTKMWRNTQINYETVAKHKKTPENWSFAGPKHHGLACSTKAFFEYVRCQNVTLESTI